jgi:ribosomal protein S11
MSLIDVDVMVAGLKKLCHDPQVTMRARGAVYRAAHSIADIQDRAQSMKTWADGGMAYLERHKHRPSESALSSAASDFAHAAEVLKTLEIELRVRMECAEMLLHALGLELPAAEAKAA